MFNITYFPIILYGIYIISGQTAEKEIVELSVHSFIDSLVGQISEAPQSKKVFID